MNFSVMTLHNACTVLKFLGSCYFQSLIEKITKQMVFVAGVGGEGNITCLLFKTVKTNGVLMLLFLGFNFLIPVLLRLNLTKKNNN